MDCPTCKAPGMCICPVETAKPEPNPDPMQNLLKASIALLDRMGRSGCAVTYFGMGADELSAFRDAVKKARPKPKLTRETIQGWYLMTDEYYTADMAAEFKRLAISAWDIVEGLTKAINYHDREVENLKEQIVENDRYAERVSKADPTNRRDYSANEVCARKIRWHTTEAKRLRDIMVMP